MGDPIPEKVKEWFGNDEALFKCLKRMVKAAYKTRLGGEEHLDSYHWERPMSELEALDHQNEERQGEVDEGGPVEEQVTSEEEEEKIRKQLTPGELITMQKDGRCTAKPVHCSGPGHVHGGDGR